jgi:hypothetical protein
MEGGKKRIRALPIIYEQSHSAPPLLIRRKRRTLHNKPPKRNRTEKPKGVKWANIEGKAPLQHVQYYFPKLYKDASKRLLATLNNNQLEALKEQQPISTLPYPEQTLRSFNREILPKLLEAEPSMSKKAIKMARKDYMDAYTEDRTQEIFRAPALLTIMMDWVIKGTLRKKRGEYKLTKKQKLDLLSEDYDELEIEIALDLLNKSGEEAERRARAAAEFAISRSISSNSSSNNSNSNSEDNYKRIMKRLHGKR